MKKAVIKLIYLILVITFLSNIATYITLREFHNLNTVLFSINILLSIFVIGINAKLISKIVKGKLFIKTTSNLTTLFLSFCILGMINFLILKNDYYVDLTSAKFHSLSEQSHNILKDLDKRKSIMKLSLYAKRSDWPRFLKLLKLYEQKSKYIELTAIDVEENPALVSINNIKDNGTVLIEYNNSKFKSLVKNEQVLTSKISSILHPQIRKIYFLIGHDEGDLDDKSVSGYSYLKEKLENNNYKLSPLELTRGIPKDCDAIFIINPKLSFMGKELEYLESYIDKGGALITLFSPQLSENNLVSFHRLFEKIGIVFNNSLILDRLATTQGSQPTIPVVNKYNSEHPITKKFSGRTLFPLSGFFKVNYSKKFNWSILLESAVFPASWGESNINEITSGKAEFDNKDTKGPLPLVLAGQYSNSRIVLFSSAGFVTNQYSSQSNNFNLFLNSFSWTLGDELLISLDRPNMSSNLVYLSDIHFSLVFYFAVLIFPFIFFFIGIYFYRKRLSS